MNRLFVSAVALVVVSVSAASNASAQQKAGIVLDGVQGADVELAARDALGKRGIPAVDRQTMAAALQFADANSLDEPGLRALAKQVGASLMVRIQAKPASGGLALRIIVVSGTASAVRLTMSKRASVATDVTKLVGQALDEVAQTPQPTPAARAGVTAPPAVGAASPPNTGAAAVAPSAAVPAAASAAGAGAAVSPIVPGLKVPVTLKPIPLSDPKAKYKRINVHKLGLRRYPKFFAFGSVNLAGTVFLPSGGDASFDTTIDLQLGAAYRSSSRVPFGGGAFLRTINTSDGSATVIGPALAANGILLGVGLLGSNDFSIADALVLNASTVLGLWKVNDALAHGFSINYTGTVIRGSSSSLHAFSVGWGVVHGGTLVDHREIDGYRKKVWKHQRSALGL